MTPSENTTRATSNAVRVTSVISGSGFCVPDQVVTNDYFASYLETSDEWIRERTGITERRWAPDGMKMSDLALSAAERAIANAGLTVADLGGIVMGTVTPDHVFPSTACVLQRRLGMKGGFAFDVNAVCSGFLYALTIADGLVAAGRAKHLLVLGGDMFSRLVNKQDRSTCVLFGDAAGAVVLSRAGSSPTSTAVEGDGTSLRGIYASELISDGSLGDLLYCGDDGRGEQVLRMAGREVFKLAVRSIAEVSTRVLARAGFDFSDLDHFVCHQANNRILIAVAKEMKLSLDKVPVNVNRYGNTSAASLPLLLGELAAEGRLKKGQLVLLSAFGGGVTWGATLLRW